MERDLPMNNAVKVQIYPLNEYGEPMSQWFWDAVIIVPNNEYIPSDEDGNFAVYREGNATFSDLESAFQWAYNWLDTRGYDVSSIQLDMNTQEDEGITRK